MAGGIATHDVARSTTREYQEHEALQQNRSLRVRRGIAGGIATHVVARSKTRECQEHEALQQTWSLAVLLGTAGSITTIEFARRDTKSMRQCDTYGQYRCTMGAKSRSTTMDT